MSNKQNVIPAADVTAEAIRQALTWVLGKVPWDKNGIDSLYSIRLFDNGEIALWRTLDTDHGPEPHCELILHAAVRPTPRSGSINLCSGRWAKDYAASGMPQQKFIEKIVKGEKP